MPIQDEAIPARLIPTPPPSVLKIKHTFGAADTVGSHSLKQEVYNPEKYVHLSCVVTSATSDP